MTDSRVHEHMAIEWDRRAETRASAMSFILNGYSGDEELFYQTGAKHAVDLLYALSLVGLSEPRGVGLEIGCGMGRLTCHMASKFDLLYATDISRQMLAMCPQLPNVVWVHTPSLLVIDSPVDFIYSHIVLQHVPKPVFWGYLQEASAVLWPGGVWHVQLHMTPEPIEFSPEETLAVRGYTANEIMAGLDLRVWEPIGVLYEAGLSEPWRWLTLRKRRS